MGLVFNKTYKGGALKNSNTSQRGSKQLTAQNIQFLQQLGLTLKTNNGYPRHNY